MDSILEQISDQESFDAFIEENMRLSSYTPLWKTEVEDTEYSSTKNFSTYTAAYGAAMVASIIDKNAEKPISQMDAIGMVTGSIARMGDRFQLDNDRLEKLLQMEDRFRNRSANFTTVRRLEEYMKIVKFLFDPYEKAAIAPHKRIDSLLFEAISNGTMTVNLANNPQGIQLPTALDLGIKKYGTLGPIWNQANVATMTPIQDLHAIVNLQKANGRIITKFRMTQNTFNSLTASNQFNTAVKLTLGNIEVSPVGLLQLDKVNIYLNGLGIPPIQIEEKYVMQRDGSVVNMFKDDRIACQSAPYIAKVIVSDSVEQRLPIPNKVYSTYEDNLISQYRTEQGRFIDYEMWGLPVLHGSDNLAIFNTQITQASLG